MVSHSGRHWFVHILGETFGPLSIEVVFLMLKQNRLQCADFIWHEGLEKWKRVNEFEEFSSFLPGYPEGPLPKLEIEPEKTSKQTRGDFKSKLRRFSRVLIEAKLHSVSHGSFDIHNISEGGVYVKSATVILPLRTNLIFQIESEVFSTKLNLAGTVIRYAGSDDPPGFGIIFTKISSDQRRTIYKYIHSKF